MNYLITWTLVFCTITFSQCMTPQKRMELFRSAAGDCAQKEGATETDLEEVLARKSASSYAQKCIRACLGEKFGLIENRKVDVEGAVFLASMAFDGPEATEHENIAREVATVCIDVTDNDRCEAVFKIQKCSENYASSKGLNIGLSGDV